MSGPLPPAGVDLKWLDGKAPTFTPTGTSFGIPWNRGEIDKTTAIKLSAGGKAIPWTGHTVPANAGLSDTLTVQTGTPAEPTSRVSVVETSTNVTVTTGTFSGMSSPCERSPVSDYAPAKFNKSGSILIDSLAISGKAQVQNGSLIVQVQNAPDEPELEGPRPTVVGTAGRVDAVTVEQNGPVRAVIKVTGKYAGGGHADFLPFTVRFYIAAGATALRMVHFFIYDADQKKDFIRGIGLRFTTPLSDELYNRHVRFLSAEGGIWGEPIRILSGLRRDATAAVLTPQFEGMATSNISTWPTSVSGFVKDLAVWADFTLDQLSSERFTIKKRTDAGRNATFLDAGFGTRAAGMGYVGGATGGGVVFALRVPHGLDLAYEDVGNPDPNPIGIGRSYEATLQLFPATPTRALLGQLAAVHTKVPQIVATPAFYASHRLFGGRWNVPNTSRSGAAAIEKRKSDLLDFYLMDIDQRQFYGFWNYGDVMHTYDQTRHTWRYDVGGFAWDNGELCLLLLAILFCIKTHGWLMSSATDLWLWISFLRTGRADVYRIAHAMTRHLSEVDSHHTGPFAGIGSRHNVSHWGDGAKEARISGSTLRRPFYYITTDELMGDLMDYTLQADQTIITWEPLRKVFPPPPPEGPGRLRIGPDWTTLAGNWFTKWERTNDTKWRDRIKVGMRDIGGFKYGLFTGNTSAVGWNADTAHLIDEGGEGLASYHLTMIFGGGEFLMEAMEVITDEPAFDAAWLDFCKLYNASNAEKIARYGKSFSSGGFNQLYAKLQAYAGERLNDTSLKQAAWNNITSNTVGVWPPPTKVGGTDVLNPISEIANLATNDAGQLSLTEYAVLAIAPELAPNSISSLDPPSLDDAREWDRSTVAGSETEKGEELPFKRGKNIKAFWRRLEIHKLDCKDYFEVMTKGASTSYAALFKRQTKPGVAF
ncbi:hypothetical protein H0H81_004077 [Sphagnurus paluster]|uniref:Uncharacterized protein n=1 Tax=Sphagnurus paluster TaxID=117069 RepID=A0A9P7GTJ4_9AGAR|nr:hypothetical protein H0H81_004077 [Sphagnurus paluster]